jgi:hypothetical protein
MTLSPEDDSDIFARLAQAESRQPLVPGGYVNEIGEQFKTQIDNLLNRRIDQFGDSLSESFASSSDKLSAKIDELGNSFKARFDLSDVRFDRLDAKLDLILELSAKIDWTKHRKSQLNQDDNAL